jgi:hypothetical protein
VEVRMMTTKAIGMHDRNCHGNKREGEANEKKKGKKVCLTAGESGDNDGMGRFG